MAVDHRSTLIEATRNGSARICAAFGGQGPRNPTCLSDVNQLYKEHRATLKELFNVAFSTFGQFMGREDQSGFHDTHQLDLETWLAHPDRAPSQDEVALAPISFPLNTLISLGQYCISCASLGLDPGQLRACLKNVVGHSQGIFAAAAIARSDSWATFYEAAAWALTLSLHVGLESHEASPPSRISSAAAADCIEHGEGPPGCMLGVGGVSAAHVGRLIEQVNKQGAAAGESISLALINTRDKLVVAGPPQSLRALCVHLRDLTGGGDHDQSRVVFNKRKIQGYARFLPISAPFHSPHLSDIAERVALRLTPELGVCGKAFGVPLLHPRTGENMQDLGACDAVSMLVRAVCVEMGDWPVVCRRVDATHLLSFGPGNIGSLVHECTAGTGLRIIAMDDPRARADGFAMKTNEGVDEADWSALFGPRLVADGRGGHRLETRMSGMLGTPPVLVAGMTPTTVAWDFCAAVINAGYSVELAGGGYNSEAAFEGALRRLAAAIPPHRSITCNLLYANPRIIGWQVASLRRLVADGIPISGITIGAGIPSPDVVKEYIETLGLQHISFKPGSQQAIDQVIDIARQYPAFPIGLQWTGGRAGGHHSFEDFHAPILKSYGRIRSCSNIVLVAGSGFGGAEDSIAYLTGEWARQFKCPPMPFDGIMLGSRMMVAAEAHTSIQAKQLIVDAPGVGDSEWHNSFDRPTGGVITINSEMGQPIHMLATRGVMLWKDFDQRIFSIKDKDKRLAYLRTHREDITSRLNRDYARPWFAKDGRGDDVEIGDMTYIQILQRLCTLLFVSHQGRWIDKSYQKLVSDYVQMAQQRFGVESAVMVQTPVQIIRWFQQALGLHANRQVYPEDEMAFMALLRRRGQKPMPFIPALDEHFETYFKKDSLWQSEDIDAVVDQDPQRICIIQGPVAVQYSKSCNESAKDILDGISHQYVAMLREKDVAQPTIEAAVKLETHSEPNAFSAVQTVAHDDARVYFVKGDVPPLERNALLSHIAGSEPWSRACLLNEWVYKDHQRDPNPIRDVFDAKDGQSIEVLLKEDGSTGKISLCITATRGESAVRSGFTLESSNGRDVLATIAFPAFLRTKAPHVKLAFQVRDCNGSYTLHEDDGNRIASFKEMYAHLWSQGLTPRLKNASLMSEIPGEALTLTREMVQGFVNVIRQSDSSALQNWNPSGSVPIDYCIVVAWKALTEPLLISALDCDLSKLLHRSINFTYSAGASRLKVGDVVNTCSRITAISIQSNGKLIEVSAEVRRSGSLVVTVVSDFFVQGKFDDHETQFESCQEPEMLIDVSSPVMLALVRSRKWLQLVEPTSGLLGSRLTFALTTDTMFDHDGNPSIIHVAGVVHADNDSGCTRIGEVYFEDDDCNGNPVTDFLNRHGTPKSKRQELESPGWNDPAPILFRAPLQSVSYAKISHDTNPIHVSPVFARFAGLPGTVVHGMHTSALVRRIVEWQVGDGDRSRFKGWQVSFDGMVRPGDQLRAEIKHIAMQNGAMILNVQAFNHATGDKVIEAEAVLEQSKTGYVFCGQGSQEKGMGMALYGASEESKMLWDRGDQFLRNKYGISLLHIVRENPTTLTIKFGGQRGRRIRANYLAMTKKSNTGNDECIVQDLTSRSTSYTFSYPKGLLFSTQFSQPALALMEMIEYAHLQAKGMTQEGSLFAGHSLGEYAALMACTSFMSFENLLELIFYRGLKMQNALPRDAHGHTEFSMMAIDPSRVSKGFEQTALENLIEIIASETDLLLELVNYNIFGGQYVTAGHLQALWILGQVCDELAASSKPQLTTLEGLQSMVRVKIPQSQAITPGSTLTRGKATIPLPGIDIPFHSKMLRPEIENYRQYLRSKLREEDVKVDELVSKWIPNVVGVPFAVDAAFVRKVAEVTGSKSLEAMMGRMSQEIDVKH